MRSGSAPPDGWHGGAANIGTKPTFGGSAVTVEVHLLDWSGDLYGQEVRVEFLERLRAERRFGSVSELTAQIHRDVRGGPGGACTYPGASLTPFFPAP